MTTLTVSLPKLVRFADYHEFGYFEKTLQEFTGNKRIRVTEVGFDSDIGSFVGIAHVGKLAKRDVAALTRGMALETE
jgi:hypothetical protein